MASKDEFIEEVYGDQDFQTAEEVAVRVAEAVNYMEWELAAEATDAYETGFGIGWLAHGVAYV